MNKLLGRSRIGKLFVTFTMLGALTSCATFFGENHYYQSVDKGGEATNYYRLKVDGFVFMSSARYISGYYDERAVDLFFNEMKIAVTPPTDTTAGKIFKDGVNDPGTQDKIKPLSPTDEHGAFVMILSSNASSVSNTIGQFAENQIIADAVTNLANRDLIVAEEKLGQAEVLSANATSNEIRELFTLVSTSGTPDKDATEEAYKRILNAIARSIDPNQESFTDFSTAKNWLMQVKRDRRK